jgi:hypothetical protein
LGPKFSKTREHHQTPYKNTHLPEVQPLFLAISVSHVSEELRIKPLYLAISLSLTIRIKFNFTVKEARVEKYVMLCSYQFKAFFISYSNTIQHSTRSQGSIDLLTLCQPPTVHVHIYTDVQVVRPGVGKRLVTFYAVKGSRLQEGRSEGGQIRHQTDIYS